MPSCFSARPLRSSIGPIFFAGFLLSTAACERGPTSNGEVGVCLELPDPDAECPSSDRATEILGEDVVGLRARFDAHEYRVDGQVYREPAQCCYDTALSSAIESDDEELGS